MSEEILVQFDKDNKPIRIVEFNTNLGIAENVMLCVLYDHNEDVDNKRVGNNNFQTARFAGQLIRELGFTIPHPEFYPDEYTKFEEDWKEFTEFAKEHRRIIELLRRGFSCIYDILDPNKADSIELLDGVADDLKKLGVLKMLDAT